MAVKQTIFKVFFYGLILCGVCLPAHKAFAGAWPMPPGEGQIISSTVYNKAGRGYDNDWTLNQTVSFSKVDTQFYMEHGLTKRITLVGSTAFQDVDFTSREGAESVTGFGASALGARFHFYTKNKTSLAVQASYILAGEGEIIPDADLGRGGNGIEFRALAGRSFKLGGRDAFADIQSAWIYRAGMRPDTFKDDLTLGLQVFPKYQLLAQGFYNRTNARTLGTDRILRNESVKLQLSLVQKRSERSSYQYGIFRTVAGRNIVQESGVFAGYWRRY